MAKRRTLRLAGPVALVALAVLAGGQARADAVSEWNIREGRIITTAGVSTPEANRIMAISHTAA